MKIWKVVVAASFLAGLAGFWLLPDFGKWPNPGSIAIPVAFLWGATTAFMEAFNAHG